MNSFHIHIDNTPVGDITVEEREERIASLRIGRYEPGEYRETPLLLNAAKQLDEYFSGKRKNFELPLLTEGTAFRKKVWQVLEEIPFGQTVTYGELAARLGCPNSARAIGSACGANPVLIIIPCHRVVGKNGLTGYAGGTDAKKTLLKIEKFGNNY